jgi:hypothetical protein
MSAVSAGGLMGLWASRALAEQGAAHGDPIKTLGECAKACDEAARHCLDELRDGGQHAERHAKANSAAMDCQAFCALAATLMARKSPLVEYAIAGAAAACKNCGTACVGLPDGIMATCAKRCRECEAMCHRMTAAAR